MLIIAVTGLSLSNRRSTNSYSLKQADDRITLFVEGLDEQEVYWEDLRSLVTVKS